MLKIIENKCPDFYNKVDLNIPVFENGDEKIPENKMIGIFETK